MVAELRVVEVGKDRDFDGVLALVAQQQGQVGILVVAGIFQSQGDGFAWVKLDMIAGKGLLCRREGQILLQTAQGLEGIPVGILDHLADLFTGSWCGGCPLPDIDAGRL